MPELALSPADCCCNCPPGCFADATDPTTKQFAVVLSGILNNDCPQCLAYNAIYSPMTYQGSCVWMAYGPNPLTCFRQPQVFLRLACAAGEMTIQVDLYDDNTPYYSWSKTVSASLVTPTYLDGLSLPFTSPDGGDCIAGGSSCVIHLLP